MQSHNPSVRKLRLEALFIHTVHVVVSSYFKKMSWGKYPSIEERDLVHGTPIKVYKNGDPWFPGKRVVVNQRQHPTFESFLNYLTSTLKEERAVRRLYTPNHGTRITDYDQIKPENVYVTSHALGSNEHLKRIR